MARCGHCPVAAGIACRGDVDPRYGHLCRLAATGEPSRVAAVKALAGEPPPAPPAFPSLPRQAVNLAGAVVTHLAAGMAKVPEGERARRLGVCEGCPRYHAPTGRCRDCGCRMAIKARWASMACPLGKWDRPDDPSPSGDAA